MKRLSLVPLCFIVITVPLYAGDKGVKQTIAYVQKLQADSGGFKPFAAKGDADMAPTLRATSSAVRALKYFDGFLPNKEGCIKFVASCYDAKSGGFSDTPGGRVDVIHTAIGLMAVVDLKMPLNKFGGAIDYLNENANSFEDIRMAAAAFEAIEEKSPQARKWVVAVFKLQNKDGTFGQGPGVALDTRNLIRPDGTTRQGSFGKGPGTARDTAGCVVTFLRLNYIPPAPGVYLQTFKDGQRQSGGWGKTDDEVSDLETTYRVMRCYHMQGVRPANAEGVRSFVAKCRNPDGGYSVGPNQASSVSGTYFAGIIMHWLDGN